MLFPNLEIAETLFESDRTQVFRGMRISDQQPVIIKLLKSDYPTLEDIARFRREYAIMAEMGVLGVPAVYGLERAGNTYYIIMEDIGGLSFEKWISQAANRDDPMNIAESPEVFLQVAIAMAEALGSIHQKHIIHKDINPSNIIYQPDSREVRIIDFGLSTLLSLEKPSFESPSFVEGALAYVSPEQTGRMNRDLDYRTDLYSLGVTLYELATGVLPFRAEDPLELIHCHLARQPVAPAVLRPSVPRAVSDIIMMLLAKEVDERYQSAYGLAADLQKCLVAWDECRQIPEFAPGENDYIGHFKMSGRLYGREKETGILLERLKAAADGSRELVLLAGPPGIGKTSLVNEMHKPLTEKRGYFISGKFEHLQRGIPYNGFVQASRSMFRQILAENEEQLARWKESLLQALAPNARLLIDLIPELEMIIGAQDIVPELPLYETQNRFRFVIQNLIKVMATADHPLTIFLDDLQWADGASLKLLESLMSASELKYLLIVGAYRDNEAGYAHPVAVTVNAIKSLEASVHEIRLDSLKAGHVKELLADALVCDPDGLGDLAEEIIDKTGGNPYFIREFLKNLYSEGLLHFNPDAMSWQWDIKTIQGTKATDNVVELMSRKIQRLPEDTQKVLGLAACIGHVFNLGTLTVVYEKTTYETASNLWEAVVAGLVMPVGDAYKLVMMKPIKGEAPVTLNVFVEYRFTHDRVQQAVYNLIPPDERTEVHYRLGRHLASLPGDESVRHLFDTVNQLNLGKSRIKRKGEIYELADLNLSAGRRALKEAAFEPSFDYFSKGLSLLNEESWEEKYYLSLDLHCGAAQAAYICGQFQECKEMVNIVIDRARGIMDKISAYETQIQAYWAQHRLQDALDAAHQVLDELDFDLPLETGWTDIEKALDETRQALKGRDIATLLDLPDMTDPRELAIMKILFSVEAPAYFAAPELYDLISLKQVMLSLTYGNSPISAVAYANYGMILCGVLGDIEMGYQAGQLALALVDELEARELQAVVNHLVNWFVRPWKEPIREVAPCFLDTYRLGVETGAVVYATGSIGACGIHRLWAGVELSELAEEMKTGAEVIRRFNQEPAVHMNGLFLQTVLNLINPEGDPCILAGEAYDEESLLPRHIQEKNRSMLGWFYFTKMFLNYLFGQWSIALRYAALCEEYLDGVSGTIFIPLFYFYDSLVRLTQYPDLNNADRADILARVLAGQQKMKRFAEQAPVNNLHKYYLVEAECYRVMGRDAEAMDAYDQAIALARSHEFYNEEALALELAGNFFMHKGNLRIAEVYLKDARTAYHSWGAEAKVQDMQRRYADYLPETYRRQGLSSERFTRRGSSSSGKYLSETLDMASAIKAAQAISREIVLDHLLDRMMHIMIENAGAERGFLILNKNERLVVEAELEVGNHSPRIMQGIPLKHLQEQLSTAIVNYVIRTRESLMWGSEELHSEFSGDPYLQSRRPKSVLCLPILGRGQLLGALYMENRLTTQAFTPDRLRILGMLATQAAIALENALLYANLEQRVHERTQALATANYNLQKEITQRLKAEEYIRHMAYHDTLTGLPNRKLFHDRLSQEIARAGRQKAMLAVLFLDLDCFKEVNDSYGHEIGDLLLVEVGKRLKGAIREFDMVSRLGGDEFTLFLTAIQNNDDILSIVRRIFHMLQAPIDINGLPIQVSSSIGISIFPDDGREAEDLIWKADKAMYMAKKKGRDTYCIYEP